MDIQKIKKTLSRCRHVLNAVKKHGGVYTDARIDILKSEINQAITDIEIIERWQKIEASHDQALRIQHVRRSAFDEAYDKFIESEDDNEYTKWLNEVTKADA